MKGPTMQTIRASLLTLVLALVALALAPLTVAAQTTTACDTDGNRPLFILPPDSPGAEYGFGYAVADHAHVSLYTLRIYDADAPPAAPALSSQNVTPAATTFLGTSPTTGVGCYALPVVPVASIPRGKRLRMTLQAQGAISELSALESGRGDPFGSRLLATGVPTPARKP